MKTILVMLCLLASGCERLLMLGDDSQLGLDSQVAADAGSCAPVICQLACPGGFARDQAGCERCACAAVDAGDVDAGIPVDAGPVDAGVTDAGTAVMDGGCEVVSDCLLACQHGFARDILGCEVCECASVPVDAGCGPTFCQLPCAHGYKRSSRGCGLCQCSPPTSATCSPPSCSRLCPAGFNTDSAGCNLCECSN